MTAVPILSDESSLAEASSQAEPSARPAGIITPIVTFLGQPKVRGITFLLVALLLFTYGHAAKSSTPSLAAADAKTAAVPSEPAKLQPLMPNRYETRDNLAMIQLQQILEHRDQDIRRLDLQRYAARRALLAAEPSNEKETARLRAEIAQIDRKLSLARQLRAADLEIVGETTAP